MRAPYRSKSSRPPKGHLSAVLVTAALLLLPACEATVDVRGNMPDMEDLTAVTPGSDNREDVLNLLGTPSTLSTFEEDKWYYIGQKVEQFAFFKPEVIDRRVLVVSFDENGVVDKTELLSLDDALEVDPVSRVTPTEGVEFTFMQQLFGNLGRLPGAVSGENQ